MKKIPGLHAPHGATLCGYPITGTLTFRAPSYFEWKNTTSLEKYVLQEFESYDLPVDSVSSKWLDPFHSFEYTIQIFPRGQDRFNPQDKSRIS